MWLCCILSSSGHAGICKKKKLSLNCVAVWRKKITWGISNDFFNTISIHRWIAGHLLWLTTVVKVFFFSIPSEKETLPLEKAPKLPTEWKFGFLDPSERNLWVEEGFQRRLSSVRLQLWRVTLTSTVNKFFAKMWVLLLPLPVKGLATLRCFLCFFCFERNISAHQGCSYLMEYKHCEILF